MCLHLGGAASYRSRCLTFHRVSYPYLPNIEPVSHLSTCHEAITVEPRLLGDLPRQTQKLDAQILLTNILIDGLYPQQYNRIVLSVARCLGSLG